MMSASCCLYKSFCMTLKVHVYFLLAFACKANAMYDTGIRNDDIHLIFCKCWRMKPHYPHIYFWTWTLKTLPGYGLRRSNIQPNSDNKTFLTCSPGTESTPLRKSTTPTQRSGEGRGKTKRENLFPPNKEGKAGNQSTSVRFRVGYKSAPSPARRTPLPSPTNMRADMGTKRVRKHVTQLNIVISLLFFFLDPPAPDGPPWACHRPPLHPVRGALQGAALLPGPLQARPVRTRALPARA